MLYKLKNVARRSSAFALAVAMLGGVFASALPGTVSADALNPLTERSLMLSSSSPGWSYTDGAGNATFAPPGSGANGQKTEETFNFRVSTDSSGAGPAIKAFTLQWCTAPAGDCTGPGTGTDPGESNLSIVYSSPVEGTDFVVCTGETYISPSCTANVGWVMTTKHEMVNDGQTTTEHNFITLTDTGDAGATPLKPAAGTKIWIRFNADADDYITNPGAGAFFVKINDYSEDGTGDPDDIDPLVSTKIIDGGVTVANVMNESIHIVTKVLETMAFSVGTLNPDTSATYNPHGVCDMIPVNDQLSLGDPTAEYSLSFNTAWDVFSYWRLSTNSSAGATVYYAGNTLNNTVGDDIDEIGSTESKSHYGTEQFGLALTSQDTALDSGAPAQTLLPLVATAGYDEGAGTINAAPFTSNTAKFSFEAASDTEPRAIASNSSGVLNCSTGKMRYIGNIAPATPAGIYTTKVNYIAAPKY
jgi:hypothetical protein